MWCQFFCEPVHEDTTQKPLETPKKHPERLRTQRK